MPNGIDARFYKKCSSTNRVAESCYKEGTKGPVWFVANEQTAGRGRKGRIWTSENGNLFSSLLFTPFISPSDLGPLAFIAALAVRDTFIALGADAASVTCKWPNDVLIEGKKASGILIESSASGAGKLDYVIIGIGMNLINNPTDAEFLATNLKKVTGKTVSVRNAIELLAGFVKARIEAWDIDNFLPIRDEWTQHAWGLGETRQIRTSQQSFQARLIGLNAHGGLKALLPSGEEKTIVAADVFPVGEGETEEL